MSEMGSRSERDQSVKRADATGSQITVRWPSDSAVPRNAGTGLRGLPFLRGVLSVCVSDGGVVPSVAFNGRIQKEVAALGLDPGRRDDSGHD